MWLQTSSAPAPKRLPQQAPPLPEAEQPRPEKPRKRIWLALLVLGLLAAGTLYWLSPLRRPASRPQVAGTAAVRTARTVVGSLDRSLRLSGTTAARNFIIIRAPRLRGGHHGPSRRSISSGLTLQHVIEPGSRVKKGDVVAEFDQEDMLVRLDDYEAQVSQAKASLESVDAQLALTRETHDQSIRVAKADLDKARLDVKTIPVRSAIEAELLRLAAEEAEAHHKQLLNEVQFLDASLKTQRTMAELNLRENQLEFKRIQADVDRMVMKAPIDGIVVMQTTWRAGEQGQIQQGDQLYSGQPFMQIVDTSSMVVNASVNQADSELMRVGAKARVHFDAYPDLELPATVSGIGAITREGGWRASFVKEIPVTLELDATESRVIPDLSAAVDVILKSEKDALVVPLESIFKDQRTGKPFVFLRASSGWQRREIELGLTNHVAATVLSGLNEGDVIACERPPEVSRG
jgi:HlyD family secretion protein